MRLGTLRTDAGSRTVVLRDGQLAEVSGSLRELLAAGPDRLQRAVDSAAPLQAYDPSRLGPAVPDPGKVLCIGKNYADHVAEMYASLDDPRRYLAHDVQFHRAVALASGNPIVATLMEMVTAALYEGRVKTVGRATDLSESAAMHRKIYQAIRARKPDDAREAMSKHLELAQKAFASEEAAKRKRGSSAGNSAAAKNGGARNRVKSKMA